jgi:hypothetical protein
MQANKLQANMLDTYFWMRGGIVAISLAFPIVLYAGGRVGIADSHLLNSMSAYYGGANAFARNWFVGGLWVVGAFMFLYRGFSEVEDIALNLSGLFAMLVPMIPCNCWESAVGATDPLHSVAAVSFFLCMAFVCLFCASDTISLLPDTRTKDAFRRRYRIIGALLIASPFAAVAVSYAIVQRPNVRFFVEWFGVWVFASYWWTKSAEFRITSAEKLAAHGKVENRKGEGLVRVDTMEHP